MEETRHRASLLLGRGSHILKTIAQTFLHKFAQRFPEQSVLVGTPPDEPLLIIPAPNAAIGSVRIWVSEDEIEADLEPFGHTHIAEYVHNLPAEKLAETLAERALCFLDELFADKILLWRSDNVGGFTPLEHKVPSELTDIPADASVHYWSKPFACPSGSTVD